MATDGLLDDFTGYPWAESQLQAVESFLKDKMTALGLGVSKSPALSLIAKLREAREALKDLTDAVIDRGCGCRAAGPRCENCEDRENVATQKAVNVVNSFDQEWLEGPDSGN